MTPTQIHYETIGSVEYRLCPAEGNSAAYAIVNRCLMNSNDLGYILTPGEPKVAIRASITRNGVVYPVTEIAQEAFSEMPISTVFVPKSVTAIRAKAFFRSKISLLKGCQGVKIIEAEAFARCSFLSHKLIFPAVEHIGSYAFENSIISSIVLPACLKTMSFDALYNCFNLDKVTMHGSTQILYNPHTQDSYMFLERKTAFTLKAPYTQLCRKGKCLVNNLGTELYHVFIKDGDNAIVPGSVLEIVGYPFGGTSLGAINFKRELISSTLSVDLGVADFREIVCNRPIIFQSLPCLDHTCNIHCRSNVTICHDDDLSRLNIIVYKGAALTIDLNDFEEPPIIIYKEGVRTVDVIRSGTTVIGPDVKRIKRIGQQIYYDDEDIAYRVTMQCAIPPATDFKNSAALDAMELTVPKGSLKAYAKHKVWGKAAIITDGSTVEVDRISAKRTARKKEQITDSMAANIAVKFAKMLFGENASVLREDDTITLSVPLATDSLALNNICYRKEIDIEQAGDPDIWDAIEQEMNKIKAFLYE